MKVAVLMSTYNGEKYLEEQIDSILAQEGNFELHLYIRDDGSEDKTADILKQYGCFGNVALYQGDNYGPANSFLRLLYDIPEDYDFFAFSDQDDVWDSDKILSAVSMLKNVDTLKPALYLANAKVVDEELNYMGRNVYKNPPSSDLWSISCGGGYLGCSLVINNCLASIIREGNFPLGIVMHDFYISEVCAALGGVILYDKVPHMKYRQHQNNVVGVSVGFLNTIIKRIKKLSIHPKYSIADQANIILETYGDRLSAENKACLQKVACYKHSLSSRLSMALSPKPKYLSKSVAVSNRLAIARGMR